MSSIKAKMHQVQFRRPAGGAYGALQIPYLDFSGLLRKERRKTAGDEEREAKILCKLIIIRPNYDRKKKAAFYETQCVEYPVGL